jgi:hypothetical protein
MRYGNLNGATSRRVTALTTRQCDGIYLQKYSLSQMVGSSKRATEKVKGTVQEWKQQ